MARAAARRSSGGGFFSFLFWIAVLAGAAALFGFFYFTSAIGRPGPFAEPRTFIVERGASGAGIAEKLEAEGFISDALPFELPTAFKAERRCRLRVRTANARHARSST
jgi:UPF0755 protein